MSTVTKIIQRPDGSEVKITATAMFGAGLARSVDVFVHRRETPEHHWRLCSDRPHPDWRQMSVDEYIAGGRSEMLQAASSGEILQVASMLQ